MDDFGQLDEAGTESTLNIRKSVRMSVSDRMQKLLQDQKMHRAFIVIVRNFQHGLHESIFGPGTYEQDGDLISIVRQEARARDKDAVVVLSFEKFSERQIGGLTLNFENMLFKRIVVNHVEVAPGEYIWRGGLGKDEYITDDEVENLYRLITIVGEFGISLQRGITNVFQEE